MTTTTTILEPKEYHACHIKYNNQDMAYVRIACDMLPPGDDVVSIELDNSGNPTLQKVCITLACEQIAVICRPQDEHNLLRDFLYDSSANLPISKCKYMNLCIDLWYDMSANLVREIYSPAEPCDISYSIIDDNIQWDVGSGGFYNDQNYEYNPHPVCVYISSDMGTAGSTPYRMENNEPMVSEEADDGDSPPPPPPLMWQNHAICIISPRITIKTQPGDGNTDPYFVKLWYPLQIFKPFCADANQILQYYVDNFGLYLESGEDVVATYRALPEDGYMEGRIVNQIQFIQNMAGIRFRF